MELEFTKAWNEVQSGKKYNTEINLYNTVNINEKFYAGIQWDGLDAPNMPTPVFNIAKRVIDYYVSALLMQPVKMKFVPELSNEYADSEQEEQMNRAATLISEYSDTLWEKLKIDTKLRDLARDGANSGDMCFYNFWDSSIETGQDLKGDIGIEILDGVNVHFGDPNTNETEKQPYITIEFRELVYNLKKEAKENGVPANEVSNILPDKDTDNRAGEYGDIELQGSEEDSGKATAVLRLWKENGTVYAEKSTKYVVIRKKWDLGLKKYPINWANWAKRKNSFHGTALSTEIRPNQIYINQQFALIMIFMRDMGFPKVIFNKQEISAWSNKVGGTFGINGDIDRAAKYMTPAQMNGQMLQSIDMAISYTKEFMGANDAALGDVNPDNATALAIVTRQAAIPLENIKSNIYQLVEDMGNSWLDFMTNNYGKRKVAVTRLGKRVIEEFDFDLLKNMQLRLKIEVGASTMWSEVSQVQTLDNLLQSDKISFMQYLERVVDGIIPKKKELMDEIENQDLKQQFIYEQMARFMETLQPEILEQLKSMPPEEMEAGLMEMMMLPKDGEI